MPLILIAVGGVLVFVGVRGDPGSLYDLVGGDIRAGYFQWMLAIIILGALGYVKGLENLSKLFIALVIIGLLLDTNKTTGEAAGVTFVKLFQQFTAGLTQKAPTSTGS